MDTLKRLALPLLGLMMLLFLGVNLIVSYQESTTMDEKAHIPASYSYVRYGDMRLNPEHPPLLKNLAGLPLLFFDLSFPLNDKLWTDGINEQWVLGDKFINCTDPASGVCNDADIVTFWSRVPIVFVALLLGFFIFLWTKQLAGPVAGLFAAALYFLSPNIIGHSHYVTTDIGIAAFLFFAFYFFVRFLERPTWTNVLWAGVFLGLAQLAKFSAVLLFPIFGLFAVLYGLAVATEGEDSPWKKRFLSAWSLAWKYAASIAVAFVLIWILYFFNTMNMPGDKLDAVANAVFPDRGLGPFAKNFVLATSEHPLLKPFSEYFLGVFMVFARVAGGNTYYFLGQVSNQASAWYFPVVYVLKETLPMLVLILVTGVYTLARATMVVVREGVRNLPSLTRVAFHSHIAQWLMLFFVLFYSYVSITGNLNIGFRHLFPILPFLYVLVAKTAFDMLKRSDGRVTAVLLKTFLGGLTLATLAIPVLAYPSYLSYFNAMAGGPREGWRFVTDSNYDWGQDVKRLRDFVERYNVSCATPSALPGSCGAISQGKPIEKIRVDYFGGSSPAYYLGQKFVPWHSHLPPEAGWYALSIGFLQENLYKEIKPGEISYAWLRQAGITAPVTRAGDSIFIFYVSPETLERLKVLPGTERLNLPGLTPRDSL